MLPNFAKLFWTQECQELEQTLPRVSFAGGCLGMELHVKTVSFSESVTAADSNDCWTYPAKIKLEHCETLMHMSLWLQCGTLW